MAAIGIFLTIAAGLFFYWLRCKAQFWYGLCEIVVAVIVIYVTFVPAATVLAADDTSFSGQLMSNAVGILAGIYILVRGMDNMDKDLPPNCRRIWNRLFPKSVR